MIITFWKGVFCADHQPGDVKMLVKCGFVMHEPTTCDSLRCRACRAGVGRRYWSARVEDATRLRSYCNPRALAAMKDHLGKLAASRALDAAVDVPVPTGLAYLPYQRGGIAFALRRKDTLFADQMGLGKTVEALGVANALRPEKILVVCPATLCLNWRDEAKKWLCDDYHLHVPESGDDPVPDVGDARLLVITNYDKLYGPVPRRRPAPVARMVPAPGTLRKVTSPGYLSDLAARMKVLGPEKFDRCVVAVRSEDGQSLLVHLGHYEVEAARELGWESLPTIILPTGFRPTEDELRDPGSIRLDTRLTASLRDQKWDLGVFDECHALKNPDSLRSKAVLAPNGLYDACRRALFLSGTPMENKPVEIWPLAARLCPSRFGDYWEFAKRYCGLHQEQRGKKSVWVADGNTHHSELQQRLRTSFMVRRLRQDVLKELPPKRRQLIPLDDEGVDWSRYPALTRWLAANNVAEYDAALARAESARTMQEYRLAIKHLEAVTAPFTEMSEVRHETALLKLPKCLRYTDELLSDKVESLVIFAHHRDVLEKIHAHYGEDSCVVFGDTKMDQRMPLVREFQDGKKRIFIGGLRAAGTGITLTRASTMVLFESDWNPAIVGQAEDRLCRIGQTKMVLVIHPVLDRSLDAYMVKVMVAKQTVIDKMLDQLPEVARQKFSQTGDVSILASP